MNRSANLLNNLIPITQFNRGQASRIFDRLNSENRLIVLKNNKPSAVILAPDEYTRLAEIEENYLLLVEATRHLRANAGKTSISEEQLMDHFGLSEEDIENAEDLDIE